MHLKAFQHLLLAALSLKIVAASNSLLARQIPPLCQPSFPKPECIFECYFDFFIINGGAVAANECIPETTDPFLAFIETRECICGVIKDAVMELGACTNKCGDPDHFFYLLVQTMCDLGIAEEE